MTQKDFEAWLKAARWTETMKYKGYVATCEADEINGVFHGHVLGIRDVITFQGTTFPELRQAFVDSVDDYLEFCKERGEEPNKATTVD